MAKIIVTNKAYPETLDLLRPHGEVIANESDMPWSREILLDHARTATAILAFMTDTVDDAFLAHCPELRIVACALKGFDNFNPEACARRGVWMSIVPDLLTVPTAELAVGLTIALARNVLPGDRYIRTGRFAGWRPTLYGGGLEGSTIGLLGLGAVGRAIAQRLRGFDARLLYYDRMPLAAAEEDPLDVTAAGLAALSREADYVIVALPLNAETTHLVDAGFLSGMKVGAYLVNISRGSVVDEAAVADALGNGRLAGYAADVFEMEDWARPDRPREIHPALLRLTDKTVLTPHIGSAVHRNRRAIEDSAARSIIQALGGGRPDGAVNEPDQC